MNQLPVPERRDEDPINANGLSEDIELPQLPGHEENIQHNEPGGDTFNYAVAFNFGFVGVGQAGTRIAQTFHSLGYRRVCVIDGAHQDLLEVKEGIEKLDLGTGMAKQIEDGAAAIASRSQDVWELLTRSLGRNIDYILVCASLGGGTGAGGTPKVIEVARKYMESIGRPVRVGCIVALPMLAEGQRAIRNALTTFQRLWSLSPAPMIIVDNQRIHELYRVGVTKIYERCNEQTAKLFHLFNQLAAQRSRLLTLDAAELGRLLNRGISVFGASEISKHDSPADVSSAVRDQLNQTVLAKVDLKTGQEAGCLFTASEETLDKIPIDVFDGGFDMLNRMLMPESIVHRGIYKSNHDQLRCFTLVSGLAPPRERLEELGAKAQISRSTLASYLGVDDSQT